MERVLKELTIATFGLPDPLHFEKDLRSIAPVAEGEVNASTFERISRRELRVSKTGHPSSYSTGSTYALRNRRLVREAAEVVLYLLDDTEALRLPQIAVTKFLSMSQVGSR